MAESFVNDLADFNQSVEYFHNALPINDELHRCPGQPFFFFRLALQLPLVLYLAHHICTSVLKFSEG